MVIGSHDRVRAHGGRRRRPRYRRRPIRSWAWLFAGGGTDWSLSQGLGGGKSDAFQAGVYGATVRPGLSRRRLRLRQPLDVDRPLPLCRRPPHRRSSMRRAIGGRLEGGYRPEWMFGGITPYAAIQAKVSARPSIMRPINGGGFGLGYVGAPQPIPAANSAPASTTKCASDPGAVLALRARLAWAHDWVSDRFSRAVFQTLPGAGFIVNGATPAQNFALASAGAELRLACCSACTIGTAVANTGSLKF